MKYPIGIQTSDQIINGSVLIDECDKPILDVPDLDYQVEHLGRNIHQIGVNFSSETSTIEEWKEK